MEGHIMKPLFLFINRIREHFNKLTNFKIFPFIFSVCLEQLSISLVVGYIISLIFPDKYFKDPFDWNHIFFFRLYAIFVGPIIETLLFQAIPIKILWRLTKSKKICLIGSILLFAVVHIFQGWLNGFPSGVIGGFYYAFSYFIWRERNVKYAFLITAGIHMIYNLSIIIIMIFLS
jgi:hypothetical protein